MEGGLRREDCVRIAAVYVLLLLCSCAGLAQGVAPDPRYTEVFVAGEKGYNTFRIPSIIAAGRGTLLACAEGRREGRGDAGDIGLVLGRSSDGGRSWSALQGVGVNGV